MTKDLIKVLLYISWSLIFEVTVIPQLGGGGGTRKIAALVFVNLTRCSLKLDHVNLVAPGSPTDGSMQAILTQLPV